MNGMVGFVMWELGWDDHNARNFSLRLRSVHIMHERRPFIADRAS